jgi:hypothetical protein
MKKQGKCRAEKFEDANGLGKSKGMQAATEAGRGEEGLFPPQPMRT